MNVTWYVNKFDEATWQVFASIGLTRTTLRDAGRGMAGLRQDIAYKRELWPGDVITVRSGILEMKPKVMRFVHEMTRDDTGEVAAITVLVAAHIDTSIRKACPFPHDVFEKGRALVVDYEPDM
jgi:acyl-CoA thioester hydrolase